MMTMMMMIVYLVSRPGIVIVNVNNIVIVFALVDQTRLFKVIPIKLPSFVSLTS